MRGREVWRRTTNATATTSVSGTTTEADPSGDPGDALPCRAGEEPEEREARSPDDRPEHIERDEAPVRHPRHPRETRHEHAKGRGEPPDEHGVRTTAADVLLCPIEVL